VELVTKDGFSIPSWGQYRLRFNRLRTGEIVFLRGPRCLCIGISPDEFAKFHLKVFSYPFKPVLSQEVSMKGVKILLRRGTREQLNDYIDKNPLDQGEVAFTYDEPALYIGISEKEFAKIEGKIETY
jgi:hypothetical protein